MGRPRATSLLAGVATLGVSVVLVACSSPGPGGFSWTEVDGPGRLELGDLTASVEDVPIHEAEQQSSNCLVGEDGRVSGEGTWFIDPVGKMHVSLPQSMGISAERVAFSANGPPWDRWSELLVFACGIEGDPIVFKRDG